MDREKGIKKALLDDDGMTLDRCPAGTAPSDGPELPELQAVWWAASAPESAMPRFCEKKRGGEGACVENARAMIIDSSRL